MATPLEADRAGIQVTRAAERGPGVLLRLTWSALALFVVWLSFQDVGVENQLALAIAAVAGLVLMKACRLSETLRLLFTALATFMTLRYLAWRITETLPGIDTLSFIPGALLFLAELYGIGMYFFGVFVNVRPIDREILPLPEDESELPTVDVLVPSYDESPKLLETTLIAARKIRYPAHKLNVYLLDDGGTEQKRSASDPVKARAAAERHETLKALCAELGVHYLTRARNEHAKAGNINAALSHVSGELVVILDADHVPTRDFLENTVGQFLADPKVFLVQTPHFFISPDPIERNLHTWRRMPSENEMFYCEGQRGLDFWNATFFCGSAAVLRRSCLDEIGGIAGVTVTEDAETALELHARGYRSVYIRKPMIAGLSPETFVGFIGQRTRWAQGMVQIFLLKNPLFKRGLSLAQRIAYTSNCFFWLFPVARVLFLAMPLTYLFFGMEIYNASLEEFLAYALAHLICSLMLTNHLFGRTRWPFISELYEMAQSLFIAPAILSVLLRPRSPSFKVTAKAETLEKSSVSPLASPILWMFLLTLAGAAAGAWRYVHFPLEHENLAIVFGWNTISLLFMAAALGVVYERRQRRHVPRTWRDQAARVVLADTSFDARLQDLSIGGAQLLLGADAAVQRHLASPEARLEIALPESGETVQLPLQVRHVVVDEDDEVALGVRFAPRSLDERERMVELCYGSSDVWDAVQKSRQRRRTILGGFVFLLGLAVVRGGPGLAAILRERMLLPDARRLLGGRPRRIAMPEGGGA